MTLRVGSWPGYGARHNPFLGIFLDGLAQAGCEIVSFERSNAIGAAPVDVVLLHWPELVFAEATGRLDLVRRMSAILRRLDRLPAGTRRAWIVHNLGPHEASLSKRLLWPPFRQAIGRRMDLLLTLSPGTVGAVRAAFPGLKGTPIRPIWHPAYAAPATDVARRAAARASRGIEPGARVIGYCGQVRPYKGIDRLIESFRKTEREGLRLLIAGRPASEALAAELVRQAAGDTRILLDLRDLSRDEFANALDCCDVFAVTMRSYLHSGSMLHALSAGLPVIARATPFAESLASELGSDWVATYDGELDPQALAGFAFAARAAAGPDLSAFAPDRVGRATAAIFRDLADNRAS